VLSFVGVASRGASVDCSALLRRRQLGVSSFGSFILKDALRADWSFGSYRRQSVEASGTGAQSLWEWSLPLRLMDLSPKAFVGISSWVPPDFPFFMVPWPMAVVSKLLP
jgi:hypothetical protein